MGAAGSKCRVGGRFGVFVTGLLQKRSGLLPVCYAEVWLLVQLEGVRVAGDSYLN
ncbi:unannotated protein [freshwater metagenome]|uniref:Unannotated protein n=1 Tax=freshwater metagenome TaxID=449393 RepID=A0A6J7EM31_9ZZZZ